MGLGDWIMCTAQVRELNERTRVPVMVVDQSGRPQWNEVFENNPRITRDPATRHIRLYNSSGNRPYIRDKLKNKWVWQQWLRQPGELYLIDSEEAFGTQACGKIYIEPHTKVKGSNKAWPFSKWQQVVDSKVAEFVQCGPPGTLRLRGATFVETKSFRQALGVLHNSAGFVGTEGGLHHAAAAMGLKAVVLWSEYIGPEITGYDGQVNIRQSSRTCGARLQCYGCVKSMLAIKPEEVIQSLKDLKC